MYIANSNIAGRVNAWLMQWFRAKARVIRRDVYWVEHSGLGVRNVKSIAARFGWRCTIESGQVVIYR